MHPGSQIHPGVPNRSERPGWPVADVLADHRQGIDMGILTEALLGSLVGVSIYGFARNAVLLKELIAETRKLREEEIVWLRLAVEHIERVVSRG